MLAIFNTLAPFFEDNYRKINVREFARMQSISPPHSSKTLKSLEKEGLLLSEEDRRYLFFYANRANPVVIHLSRLYWHQKLQKSELIGYLKEELLIPTIVLFGSFSKAEVAPNSDIDIAVFTATKKRLDLEKYEKKLKFIHVPSHTNKTDYPSKGNKKADLWLIGLL